SGCRAVTAQSLADVCDVPTLTHLSAAFSGLTSAVVSTLLTHEFEQLDLSYNPGITDATFRPPPNTPNTPNTPTRLKVFEIAHCCITSHGLSLIAQTYTALERLNAAGLKDVEDSALRVLGSCCPHLAHLNLNDCTRITDAGVVFICKHMRLHTLHLSYTTVITDLRTSGSYEQYSDIALRALLSANLREVTLCNQQGLQLSKAWFFDTFPRVGNYSLQRLDLRGCVNLQGNYLHCTLRSCRLLNDVHLPAHFVTTGTVSVWNYIKGPCVFLS
ncbi:hypothetical protein B484DRAFT_291284, partial [Ochromonadaceae sp. CCMP2298]